jgi:hypothetical protein
MTKPGATIELRAGKGYKFLLTKEGNELLHYRFVPPQGIPKSRAPWKAGPRYRYATQVEVLS